ncbi:DUF2946 family protein [Mesorhizobium sp. BR1-1-16]|uniref:DUF2946 family protein n=1 Tax=Mesorhizobium sp. BR1-1-16 TaxID=2876653 RepID=UPI00336A169D
MSPRRPFASAARSANASIRAERTRAAMTRTQRRGGLADDAVMLVALFLVIQALLSGLATGAQAEIALRSDVICGSAGSSSSAGPASQPSNRTHLVDCCTLGCPMTGGAVPTPAAFVLPGTSHELAVLEAAVSKQDGLERSELAPLHSRAPPDA